MSFTIDTNSNTGFYKPQELVGRYFYIDFRQVKIETTYHIINKRYYLCRWTDTCEVWTCPAEEIFIFFDDNGKALKDFDNVGTLEDILKDYR